MRSIGHITISTPAKRPLVTSKPDSQVVSRRVALEQEKKNSIVGLSVECLLEALSNVAYNLVGFRRVGS